LPSVPIPECWCQLAKDLQVEFGQQRKMTGLAVWHDTEAQSGTPVTKAS
jgi:hypothetical protein